MIAWLKLGIKPTAVQSYQLLSRYHDTFLKKSGLRDRGRGGPSLIPHYLAASGVLA